MKQKIASIVFVLSFGINTAQQIEKLWEVTGLESPESVVYDKQQNVYYVSNVAGQPAEKNELGYITIIDTKGNIKTKKWVTGLDAPKGLGLYKGILYVADIDKVVSIDTKTGKIIKLYKANGATFLNDIEIDKDGTVYITDTFGGNAIFRIKNDKIETWLKDELLDYPNGLKLNNGLLYVASWGVVTNPQTFETEVPGKLLSVNLETKKIIAITKPQGNYDGLEVFDDTFLVSDWIAGSLVSVNKKGETKELLDLKPGSADMGYGEEKNVLLIPQMLDGILVAYKLSK
ncbi:hypothetical protein [uncultured Aquimarina sp.]|uniref:SMP-30/gluconolactonase/LRE family protein n=1 Tax=uncultured Aquimarina sp. TaxID=575652 RepID=UPI00261ACFCC|nr:hypothetical protein [uncultured Aquimarina sp.]